MVHHVLNECLIDRGASPSMVWMECHIDGYHVTNILVRSLWQQPAPAPCPADLQLPSIRLSGDKFCFLFLLANESIIGILSGLQVSFVALCW